MQISRTLMPSAEEKGPDKQEIRGELAESEFIRQHLLSQPTIRCAGFVLSHWNESLVLLLYNAQDNLWSIWVSGESCSFLFIAETVQVEDSK